MIVHFVGGPLAGLKLATTEDPWAGSWFSTEGAAEWTLYVPVHRDPVTGEVMAEERTTAPRSR
ncbi:hypothetical protein LXH09_37045 [Streptomyces sp. CS7]|uniref:hypothetical protein n=1 Tax=Streptomyces sp. CS-7 TaxID=2906769 RepID=UPI0021B4080E|nr:hypothetical protein [Streptomyces sp. CS-7]MCT6782232.1 hypothetical protein [Streptomyces sp. CS-7]